jgi:hypothetical protein
MYIYICVLCSVQQAGSLFSEKLSMLTPWGELNPNQIHCCSLETLYWCGSTCILSHPFSTLKAICLKLNTAWYWQTTLTFLVSLDDPNITNGFTQQKVAPLLCSEQKQTLESNLQRFWYCSVCPRWVKFQKLQFTVFDLLSSARGALLVAVCSMIESY